MAKTPPPSRFMSPIAIPHDSKNRTPTTAPTYLRCERTRVQPSRWATGCLALRTASRQSLDHRSSYVAGDARSRQKTRMRRIRATGFSPQMARAIVALLLLLAIVLPVAANDVREGIITACPFAWSTASLITAHITTLLIVLVTTAESSKIGRYRKVPMREDLRRKRICHQPAQQGTETAPSTAAPSILIMRTRRMRNA